MQINTYLFFQGQCEEAFKFYATCLGGKIEAKVSHEGTPGSDHVRPEWRNKIIHAGLVVGNGILMGSDQPPDQYQEPRGFSVSLNVHSSEEGGVPISSVGARRNGKNPARTEFLRRPLWNAGRSLRHSVDDRLSAAGVDGLSE